jgi:hypothetical protein
MVPFLGNEIMPSQIDSLGQWSALADKLLRLGYEIGGAAGPELQRNDDQRGDIRLTAVSLIARSLSNMRGTLILTRATRAVEARVLARCILENQFWLAGFADDPDKFRGQLVGHEMKKKVSSGQTLFETGEMPDAVELKLREFIRENKAFRKGATVSPKQLAKDANVGDAYAFYDYLSVDAHPTVTTLSRYVVVKKGATITGLDLDPAPREGELADTVSLACYALLGALLSAGKILNSPLSENVDAIAREYMEMMNETVEADQDARRDEEAIAGRSEAQG